MSDEDKVDPAHYSVLDPTPFTVIQAWQLSFALGNIVKYVARYSVTKNLVDLKKAKQYLDWTIYAGDKNVD